MSVAKVTEISSTSREGFDEAIRQGIARANRTLKNVSGVWVKEMKAKVEDGAISEFQVNMKVTFVLE